MYLQDTERGGVYNKGKHEINEHWMLSYTLGKIKGQKYKRDASMSAKNLKRKEGDEGAQAIFPPIACA